MAKKSFLSKLRQDSSSVMDEEQRLKKELMDLRIKQSSGQLKEIHKIKETKKAIAQLKTVVNENPEEKKT
tara:strand:+ start:1680 stop:1889 length:210 start_codon:yes stop_codon:yes gene_type:complete